MSGLGSLTAHSTLAAGAVGIGLDGDWAVWGLGVDGETETVLLSQLVVGGSERRAWTEPEVRVIDAVATCCERWGIDKVTIDDIAKQSGLSRATLYRMFPGGRDVIFDAHRVYELDRFFAVLLDRIAGSPTLEELLVRAVTCATNELRNDDHLAVMLASEPGAMLSEITVDGMPRITRVAAAYLVPFVEAFLPRAQARALIDLVARLVISYFLSPSEHVDLGNERQAREFLAPFVPPESPTSLPSTTNQPSTTHQPTTSDTALTRS